MRYLVKGVKAGIEEAIQIYIDGENKEEVQKKALNKYKMTAVTSITEKEKKVRKSSVVVAFDYNYSRVATQKPSSGNKVNRALFG